MAFHLDVEFYVTGIIMTVICMFGLAANSLTLFILNGFSTMRRQSINIYLTVLAIFDNGVLINAFLMLSIPALAKNLDIFPHLDLEVKGDILSEHTDISSTLAPSKEYTISQAAYTVDNTSYYTLKSVPITNFVTDEIPPSVDGNFSPSLTTNYSYTASSSLHFSSWSSHSDDKINDPLEHSDSKEDTDYPTTQRLNLRGMIIAHYIEVVYPLALISQTGSTWSLCLITVERYLAVYHPLRIHALASRTRAFMSVIILSLCAVVYNIPRFFEVKVITFNGRSIVTQSDLRRNQIYYWVYFIFCYMTLLYIIPLSVLSVLNIRIYQAVRRANRNRASLTNQEESEMSITSMLVLLVTVFLTCHAPAFLLNFVELSDSQSGYFRVAMHISNLLVCLNSSINFLIYCIFGKKFRKKLKQVISCRKSQRRNSSQRVLPSNSTNVVNGTYV